MKNCIGWQFSPFPEVGSPVGDLQTTPSGQDSATKVGCKSQSYTSWDCVCRLYVGGVYTSEHEITITTRQRRDTTTQEDVSTQIGMENMTEVDRTLYKKGLKIFIRGKGVFTRQQWRKQQESQMLVDTASGSKAKDKKNNQIRQTNRWKRQIELSDLLTLIRDFTTQILYQLGVMSSRQPPISGRLSPFHTVCSSRHWRAG